MGGCISVASKCFSSPSDETSQQQQPRRTDFDAPQLIREQEQVVPPNTDSVSRSQSNASENSDRVRSLYEVATNRQPLPHIKLTDMPDDVLRMIAEKVGPAVIEGRPNGYRRIPTISPSQVNLSRVNKELYNIACSMVRTVSFNNIEEINRFPVSKYTNVTSINLHSLSSEFEGQPIGDNIIQSLNIVADKFPNIKSLLVADCPPALQAGQAIGRMTKLKALKICSSRMDDAALAAACENKPDLECLDIANNNIGMLSKHAIKSCRNIKELRMTHCKLNDDTAAELLVSHSNLTHLTIRNSSDLGFKTARAIGNMSNLNVLSIENNVVGNQFYSIALENKEQLKKLVLSDILVTQDLVEKISTLPLTYLCMKNCSLTYEQKRQLNRNLLFCNIDYILR